MELSTFLLILFLPFCVYSEMISPTSYEKYKAGEPIKFEWKPYPTYIHYELEIGQKQDQKGTGYRVETNTTSVTLSLDQSGDVYYSVFPLDVNGKRIPDPTTGAVQLCHDGCQITVYGQPSPTPQPSPSPTAPVQTVSPKLGDAIELRTKINLQWSTFSMVTVSYKVHIGFNSPHDGQWNRTIDTRAISQTHWFDTEGELNWGVEAKNSLGDAISTLQWIGPIKVAQYPKMISPNRFGERFVAGDPIKFEWMSDSSVTNYEVQVMHAQDAGPTNFRIETNKPKLLMTFDQSAEVSYNIYALNKAGVHNGTICFECNFKVNGEPSYLKEPVEIVSPKIGAAIKTQQKITFAWNAFQRATSYIVHIGQFQASGYTMLNRTIETTETSQVQYFDEESEFSWGVEAKGGDNGNAISALKWIGPIKVAKN